MANSKNADFKFGFVLASTRHLWRVRIAGKSHNAVYRPSIAKINDGEPPYDDSPQPKIRPKVRAYASCDQNLIPERPEMIFKSAETIYKCAETI